MSDDRRSTVNTIDEKSVWKSTAWNGLDPAFRNSVLALIALVITHLPSPHWQARASRTR